MAFQILLNFGVAFVWMFIVQNFSGQGFIVGYVLGLILLIGMRRFFKSRLYIHRVWAAIKLTWLFIGELIKANIAVLKVVLKPQLDMQPAFFAYPTDLKEDWEIVLLSSLITLTPGTVVIHVSDDAKTLYIHAIDCTDVDGEIDGIRTSFERAIKEVSRA